MVALHTQCLPVRESKISRKTFFALQHYVQLLSAYQRRQAGRKLTCGREQEPSSGCPTSHSPNIIHRKGETRRTQILFETERHVIVSKYGQKSVVLQFDWFSANARANRARYMFKPLTLAKTLKEQQMPASFAYST